MIDHTFRFNKEYFGYIVGFPDGRIMLTTDEARPHLEGGAGFEVLQHFELKELEVRKNFYLDTPPLVWLEITKKCNLKCPHCYIDGGLAREDEMSNEEIYGLIDELAEMGVWAVAFTGGEPTLHPGFSAFVKHARRRNLLVGIATHGLHLTRELLDELPRDGTIISISIDDLHVVHKNADTEFSIASKALLRCREMGFQANIMTNTNRKNIDHLDRIVSWAEENQVSLRSVPFSPIGERAKMFASELENVPEDAEKAARFWLKEVQWEHRYHQEVGLCVGLIFNYGLTLAYMTRRCSSGRFLAYIASDGTVYPCTMCAGERIFSPGNMRKGGFVSLWRSPWEIREHSWDDFRAACHNCPLDHEGYYCSSRCPATSHARHGNFNSCGASPFEKVSLVIRTALMESSGLEEIENKPSKMVQTLM